MWLAVFGDVGVAVIAILNAMRVNSGRFGGGAGAQGNMRARKRRKNCAAKDIGRR